eukprot:CAMPEP_0113301092 /NCGR_PEP_ID=MMETSP0010_2-20120614/2465_1 /TAXON_ID=216773 ORGANISM="Corethron hystrix, Strain 308" /NCGR_SAMPLE_ID=MMETSP0010_2 /ASSEMBLY_ACC=CAM_ASM_000155 /LENGTH=458 /DNA_ID=CAMNT_0000154657 /DNA_START=153 /DNA_END=1529 /DNA_ORIENTATION=+ /assembly_acc=CAM_ASM_000155
MRFGPSGTPLHRAAQSGHLQIVWQLILSTYSVDDLDSFGNTPLHLAAAMGHGDVIKCLIEDGSDLFHANDFGMLPMDVAHSTCRTAMKKEPETFGRRKMEPVEGKEDCFFRRPTFDDRTAMHQSHVGQYIEVENALINTLDEAKIFNPSERCTIENLRSQIDNAIFIGISPLIVAAGQNLLHWMENEKDLSNGVILLGSNSPILTEEAYCKFVYTLQMTMHRVKARPQSPEQGEKMLVHILSLLSTAQSLVDRSHAEFGLRTVQLRAVEIECANEGDVPLMDRLSQFITKAKSVDADEKLVGECEGLRCRLVSEKRLRECIARLPNNMRLPVENMTPRESKEYWQESDIGHIKQTPEYPNMPPLREGETEPSYVWVASDTLRVLRDAVKYAREAFLAAESAKTKEKYLSEFESILVEKEEEKRILEIKDSEDRVLEEAIARKAAKRLRAKGRKKKKKK